MHRILAVATGAALAVLGWSAQALTWDMPTPYGETNFHTVNIKQFARDVEAATDGSLTIKVHSAGSLFKHPEIKNAVRGGQVPIGEFLLSRLANENAVFQVDSIPFLATGYEDAERLWAASRPFVEKLLAEEGLQVLFSVPWPPQGLYARQEVDAIGDLKGVKFRAYNTATERLAELAGAVPTQVEVPDIPQAFATGRVEAMITSPSTGANTKAWDFVSHFHHTQAWLPKNIVVVNKRAFDRLDPAIQEAVLQAAAQGEDRGWRMSREETAEKIRILREHGMHIHDPPSRRLMQDLKSIGATMTEDWAERAGEDGRAILEAYRQ